MNTNAAQSRREQIWLWIILIAGLIQGLIFIKIVPPWQHYDEPNHFEYVWLFAFSGRIPAVDDFNPELSRMVMGSMVENNFFGEGRKIEEFIQPNQDLRIFGQSQLEERPFYYLAASLPIRLLDRSDVLRQLYISRFVSLLFYMISILLAWAIVRELTGPGNRLRWMAPLGLALMPAYADIMTAVNNDSAAVVVFSLMLWGCLRIVKRGFSWVGLLWLVGVGVLSYFTKATAMISLVLVPVALIFSLLRGRFRLVAWALLLLGVVLGLALTLERGDAAAWYRSSFQGEDSRTPSPQAVLGEHVIQIESNALVSPSWMVAFFQPTSGTYGDQAAGKTFTLGGWVWADGPIEARSPILGSNNQFYSKPVELTIEPTFFAISMTVEDDPSNRVWVNLDPRLPNMTQSRKIYYDGLVLAEGERSADDPPQYFDEDGLQGEWGGEPFNNLLRNGSAEHSGLRFRPVVDKLGAKLMLDRITPSFILSFLLGWGGASWAYRLTGERIFRTFWGTFGWGHVPLLYIPFWLLLSIAILGLAGAIVWFVYRLWKSRTAFPWEIVVLLLLAVISAWGAAFIRGSIYLALPRLYIPVARYGFVAIAPTLLILVGGWLELARLIEKKLHVPLKVFSIIYVVFWLGLAGTSLYSILSFY